MNRERCEGLLGDQERVLGWRQAVECLGAGKVRGLLHSGRWQRAAPGVLVAHNGSLSREEQEWVAVLSAGPGALLAGLAAARLCGLRGYEEPLLRVLVPARRRVAPRAVAAGQLPVRVHRTSEMAARDALTRGRPPQTTIARSLVDAAQWAVTDDRARAIVMAGFQQRLTAADETAEVLRRMPRARRRALIAETVADAAGGSHSLPERELLELCRRYGLPQPDQQVARRDARGRRRWLDAYWPEWRLHVEVDGGQHTEVREWWADMWRQNELWVCGDRVLRFPSWAIRRQPARVAAQIRAALAAAERPARDLGI